MKSVFTSLFGYSWDLDARLFLKYEYTDEIWIDVELDKQRKSINVRYSEKLFQKIKGLEEEALKLYDQKSDATTISLAYASKERLRNYDNFKNSVNEIFADNKETYYIPAGRILFSLCSRIASSLYSILRCRLGYVVTMKYLLINAASSGFSPKDSFIIWFSVGSLSCRDMSPFLRLPLRGSGLTFPPSFGKRSLPLSEAGEYNTYGGAIY